MESKQTKKKRVTKAVFVPKTMGIFILLIIVLSLIAGTARQELVLILNGVVFFAVWAYCLIMTLLLALIHRRRAREISIRVSPREITAGGQAEVTYSEDDKTAQKRGLFHLPGILVRCRLLLFTRDGRRVRYEFRPENRKGRDSLSRPYGTFDVKKRGAYFSDYDEFAIFDMPGFFYFAWRIPHENGVRLLVCPRAADEPVSTAARAGETNRVPEQVFQRTDNLIEHRPYVPGDDPRRINWKLYSHGGGLFVREGEREPPPHSNILILVDTQYDPLLYSAEAARHGIDLLCENALAAALAAPEGGMDLGLNALIGFSGGAGFAGGTPAELAAALALPAAVPLSGGVELPAAPEDRGVLVFALPRSGAESSALDRFLKTFADRGAGRNTAQTVELIFLYERGARAAAAEKCAALYNRGPGVKARAIGI
jgi:uncharacterized protein (DUF58 family)